MKNTEGQLRIINIYTEINLLDALHWLLSSPWRPPIVHDDCHGAQNSQQVQSQDYFHSISMFPVP